MSLGFEKISSFHVLFVVQGRGDLADIERGKKETNINKKAKDMKRMKKVNVKKRGDLRRDPPEGWEEPVGRASVKEKVKVRRCCSGIPAPNRGARASRAREVKRRGTKLAIGCTQPALLGHSHLVINAIHDL